MAAFIAFGVHHLRNLLKWVFPQSRHNLLIDRTPYGLPVPETIHRTVTEEELRGRRLVIIGDVHGCYEELVELLDLCNVNNDDLCPVFVGDLVRKGPLNAEVVKLVRQLDGFCVRGNADEIEMLSWQRYVEKEEELDKSSEWMKDLSKEDHQWLLALPFTLSFPTRNIIVTHAGLLPGVDLANQSLSDLIHLRDVTFDSKSLTFSGHTKYQPNGQPWAQAWPGPEHVYFGHDAKRFHQSYPYATGMDLGCVYGGHLAAVFPDKNNEIVKVKSRQPSKRGRVESAP